MAESQGRHGMLAALGAETFEAWVDLNQRVVQDLTRSYASATEEASRTAAEAQQSMFAAWRAAQEAAFRWQALWPEAFRDPMGCYQRAVEHGLGVVHDTIEIGRRNAETTLHAFDRLQSRSAETARTLEDTVKEGATKIRDIQNRRETLRAA